MPRAWLWTLSIVAVPACGNAQPPREAPTTVDAGAPTTAEPEDAGSLRPRPFVDARPEILRAPLPSGDYEITTQLVADSCNAADGGGATPEPITMFVPMKASAIDGTRAARVVGNFPLPLARNGRFGVARSDIVLDPPAGERSATQHGYGSQCLDYETKTTYRVLQVIGPQIDIRYVRDYGDAGRCPRKARLPSNCTIEYRYTFKLVNKVCDAICSVQFTKSDGGFTSKCDCPGATGR